MAISSKVDLPVLEARVLNTIDPCSRLPGICDMRVVMWLAHTKTCYLLLLLVITIIILLSSLPLQPGRNALKQM
jgi:hypothetical protein